MRYYLQLVFSDWIFHLYSTSVQPCNMIKITDSDRRVL